MTNTYEVLFINNSSKNGTVSIFQSSQTEKKELITPVNWLNSNVNKQEQTNISWNNQMFFFWGYQDDREVIIKQRITIPIDNELAVEFFEEKNDYKFGFPEKKEIDGKQVINCNKNIKFKPQGMPSIGVGMEGKITNYCTANANKTSNFPTNPDYHVNFYSADGSVSVAKIVDFAENVYSMTVTLNPDYTLTVNPTV